jgi:isoquinoline 1-oxidoreductase beta subunit
VGLLAFGFGDQARPADIGSDSHERLFRKSFLRIEIDGSVTVYAKRLEMGQGIWTGLCQIVAGELDADWEQMKVEAAPARLPDYAHTLFKDQSTGGSTSISNS